MYWCEVDLEAVEKGALVCKVSHDCKGILIVDEENETVSREYTE